MWIVTPTYCPLCFYQHSNDKGVDILAMRIEALEKTKLILTDYFLRFCYGVYVFTRFGKYMHGL